MLSWWSTELSQSYCESDWFKRREGGSKRQSTSELSNQHLTRLGTKIISHESGTFCWVQTSAKHMISVQITEEADLMVGESFGYFFGFA